jgi:ankyrin repeat protein
MGDETPQHNPPLLHYLDHHPQSVSTMGQFAFSSKSKGIETCHVDHFDDFFATADLKVKNGLGNGALHIVAANDRSLDGEEIDDFPKRPDGHDAEVMRFLVGEKGLDPLLEDAKGRSSLDLAAALGRGAILNVFKPQN